jgi:hypothetical protein
MANYAGDIQVQSESAGTAYLDILLPHTDGNSRSSMGFLMGREGEIYVAGTDGGNNIGQGGSSVVGGVVGYSAMNHIQVPIYNTSTQGELGVPVLWKKGTYYFIEQETDYVKVAAAMKNRRIVKIHTNRSWSVMLVDYGVEYERMIYVAGNSGGNTYAQLGQGVVGGTYENWAPMLNYYSPYAAPVFQGYIVGIQDIFAPAQNDVVSANQSWLIIAQDGDVILEVGSQTANGSVAVPANANIRILPALPSGKKVKQVMNTSRTIWAIDVDGAMYSMGTSARGQLGNGGTVSSLLVWQTISFGGSLASKMCYGGNDNYETIAVLTTDGKLWCWGANGAGQVGDGTLLQKNSPVNVLSNVSDMGFSGGGNVANAASVQTFAISDGRLYIWGSGGQGNGNGGITDVLTPTAILYATVYRKNAGSTTTLFSTIYPTTSQVFEKVFSSGSIEGGFAITKGEYGRHLYAWGQAGQATLGLDPSEGGDGSSRFLRPARVPLNDPIEKVVSYPYSGSTSTYGLAMYQTTYGQVFASADNLSPLPVGQIANGVDNYHPRAVLWAR